MNHIQNQKLYLNEAEASFRYGLSRQWFQRERWKKTGPQFIKINGTGKILYPLEETDKWFKSFGMQHSNNKTLNFNRQDLIGKNMFSIDGENIAWCSDFTLKRAKDEIEFEIAKREYKKIQEENQEKCQFDSGSVAEVC